MPVVNPRTLIGRWTAGTLPGTWAEAHRYLRDLLRRLESVLRVLHNAVEHPAPSLGSRVAPTATTAITTGTATDLTGCSTTYTPSVDGTLFVIAAFYVRCDSWVAITDQLACLLNVNGTVHYGASTSFSAVNERRNLSQFWLVTVQAGTTYTLKMQGRVSVGTSTFSVLGTPDTTATGFTYIIVPNSFKVT